MCPARFTICAVLVFLFTFAASSHAGYSGGSGTEAEPFRIGAVSDWEELMATPADWASHFVLIADLDMNGVTLSPVGNNVNNFTGVFDGNDHKISNFGPSFTDEFYAGLFGRIGLRSHIKNLGLDNVHVNVIDTYFVSALVGSNYEGTITNCYFSGVITGSANCVGGIAGENWNGTITECHSHGNIEGYRNTGGIVGDNKGVVANSYSTVNISGSYDETGGLAGGNSGVIENCYSTGAILGIGWAGRYVGGLVGENAGVIRGCYSTSSPEGEHYVGGLVGSNEDKGTITACYAVGTVSVRDDRAGGLVGNNYGTIENCYSTGRVLGGSYVGGLVGDNDGTIINCYSIGRVSGTDPLGGLVGYGGGVVNSLWNTETSGESGSAGGRGRITAELQTASTFLGWNGCGEIVWTIDDGNDYPRLVWEGQAGEPLPDQKLPDLLEGGGTGSEPYLIHTPQEFNLIGLFPCEWDQHFRLMSDIDLVAVDSNRFNIIGATPAPGFTGVFDGNTYSIRNFTWASENMLHIGLFGFLAENGRIENLGLEDANVNAMRGFDVGGMVGVNYGILSECYVTGSVSGQWTVGGLVGCNEGTIVRCYSTSNAEGERYVGGLVGENDRGMIVSCCSRGSAMGDDYVGGLVGENDDWGMLMNCYSTGSVADRFSVGGLVGGAAGVVVNSFWDIETSGQSDRSGGTGKRTAEMKDASTYFGWNACGEIVWTIEDGNDYPRLLWEGQAGQPLPDQKLADFVPGMGTETVPYLISTPQQLNLIGLFLCEWDKHFLLVNGLDLAEVAGTQFNVIGAYRARFAGIFDGGGYEIDNFCFTSTRRNGIGLFGCVGKGGQIRNLGLEDVDVNSTNARSVGALVGLNDGVVNNCYCSGRVSGGSGVGGLVGYSSGPIMNCYSRASVNGSGYIGGGVGGLVGGTSGDISNSHSSGDVNGVQAVGGLSGTSSGNVSNCFSTGDVNGLNSVGGLIGTNDGGSLSRCYSSADVNGISAVGGLMGGKTGGILTNCYSSGSVSGESAVGGMVGGDELAGGVISNSCSRASIDANEWAGGLVGWSFLGSSVLNCFWDAEIEDTNDSFGFLDPWAPITNVAGLTTAQMQTRSTFTSAGWDLVGETANGSEDIWAICEGTNYPRLVWQIPGADWICPDGVGLEDFSYLGGVWGTGDPDPANLDGEDGIGFGDLIVFCEEWLSGR